MTTVPVYTDRFYDRLVDEYDRTQAEVVVSRLRNAITAWSSEHFVEKRLSGHDHVEQIRAGVHRIIISRQTVRGYDIWYVLDVQPRSWNHRHLSILDENAERVEQTFAWIRRCGVRTVPRTVTD